MDAVCVLVAATLAATLPGPGVTLAWTHSVQKTRWEERWRVEGTALRLVEASVEGSGAGMEPPAGAVLRDGAWRWNPAVVQPEVVLARSDFAGDWRLCASDGCRWVSALAKDAPADAPVVLRPCAAISPPAR